MESFGGTENPEQPPGIMPGRATCCVPLCPNNFKNSHGLAFYRIPKAKRIRREYVRLLRNDNLNLNSDSTRICSLHWDGGEKRSRTHLPSFFPWSKKKKWTTNSIQVRGNFEFKSQEKENWHFLYRNGRWGWLSKWSVSWADWRGHSKQQCFTDSFLLWYWGANWDNRRISRSLEFELKSTGEGKDKLAKEKHELARDSKRLQHALKNPTFDISKFKEKDEDIEFYTGLPHWDALMLLNDMLHD